MFKDLMRSIKARVIGKIPVRGTLTTASEKETYPVAVANELMGGLFSVENLDQLKGIPLERLVLGCKCTLVENHKATTYVLVTLPPSTLSEIPGVNISDYWDVDNDVETSTGEEDLEFEYAHDVNLLMPPYSLADISKDAYNAGYSNDTDFASGDVSKKVWGKDFNILDNSKWFRVKKKTDTDWGIPTPTSRGYDLTYNNTIFKWVLKGTKPDRPKPIENGEPNSHPVGWDDLPTLPNGVSNTTHDLWAISATFSAFRTIIGRWTDPVNISASSDLLRFGNDINNTDFLNEAHWSSLYTPGDRYIATRITNTSNWIVDKVDRSTIETNVTIYKEFQDGYTIQESDKPNTHLGYGNGGWKPYPFVTQTGYSLFISIGKIDNEHGGLVTEWSLPVRIGCNNTYDLRLYPKSGGLVFRESISGANLVQNPAQVILKADFRKNSGSVDPSEITSITWYTGSYESKTQIPNLPIGTEPNRNIQISGDELTVFPENVNDTLVVWVEYIVGGVTYLNGLTLTNISSTEVVSLTLDQPDGIFVTDTSVKHFVPKLIIDGEIKTDLTSYPTTITLDGSSLTPINSVTKEVAIAGSEITNVHILKYSIVVGGTTYTIEQDVVRLEKGESLERWYSPLDVVDPSIPPVLGDSNQWSVSSANAIWAIERVGSNPFGVPFKLKGDKGEGSGLFQKIIYRTANNGPAPSWVGVKPTPNTAQGATLTPADWSNTPEENAPTGSTVYGSMATFKKTATNSYSEITDNWAITSDGWSLPFKVTYFPAQGSSGTPGDDGDNGWSPRFSVEDHGTEAYLKLEEWIGGSGTKPIGEGYYVGSSSLLPTSNGAVNIKGPRGLASSVHVPTSGRRHMVKGHFYNNLESSVDDGGGTGKAETFLELQPDNYVHVRMDISIEDPKFTTSLFRRNTMQMGVPVSGLISSISLASNVRSLASKPILLNGVVTLQNGAREPVQVIFQVLPLNEGEPFITVDYSFVNLPSGVDYTNSTIFVEGLSRSKAQATTYYELIKLY